MNAVCKRISCIVITLFLLLSGICCTKGAADSVFVRNTFEASFSFLCVDEGNTSNTDVCTFDMLSARSATAVQYVQRHSFLERNICFLSLLYLSTAILSLWGVFYAAYGFCIRTFGCHAVILNYIHRKDGKK